jgi:S1-C subfamily serine protease
MVLSAIGGAAITAGVLLAAGGLRPAASAPSRPSALASVPLTAHVQSGSNSSSSGTAADVYAKVRPAVVEVDVQSGGESGLGTGVIISQQGEILTNAHVVAGARNVQVKLADGTTLPGQVEGISEQDDLAIVKANIPQNKLAVVKLGDSSTLKVGQQVIAIGNPFGLEGSVTEGIVSGIRNDNSDGPSPVIQTDAAINPGNSGGPLLDTNGNLIGINEALENPTGEDVFVGIGFAIPVNTVKADLNQLRSGASGSNSGGNPFDGGQNPYGGSGGPFGGNNPFDGSPFQGGNPFQGGSPFAGSPFGGNPFGGYSQ